MSAEPTGYVEWVRPLFAPGDMYLDGLALEVPPEEGFGGVTWTKDGGVFIRRTHDGSAVVFRPYRGVDASAIPQRYTFQIGLLGDSESDFIRLSIAEAAGRLVSFVPGLPACDVFPGAVSGNSYTLNRAVASDVIGSIDPGVFPVLVYLDGVENDEAATVSGRTVTATASGELAIYYMPVFQVLPLSQGSVQEYNRLMVTWALSEELVPNG